VRNPPLRVEAADPHTPGLRRLLEHQQPPRAAGTGGSVRRLDGVDRARPEEESGLDLERESCEASRRGGRGDRGAEGRAEATEPEEFHAGVETIADIVENIRRKVGA